MSIVNSEVFLVASATGTQGISDFLTPYKEFHRFNVQFPEDASIYLIAEEHSDQQCRAMQAELVNFLASQGPVIVLRKQPLPKARGFMVSA